MEQQNIDLLKYPVGKFKSLENISPEQINGFINDIELLPRMDCSPGNSSYS